MTVQEQKAEAKLVAELRVAMRQGAAIAKKCYCCGQDVDAVQCGHCGSEHVRTGVLEFVWNGFVAKRVEVGWCHKCDLVWLVDYEGNNHPVCRDCRERLLSVQSSELPKRAAA